MAAAKVIVLHGPSSSGKSTLGAALQAQIELPFFCYSIDTLRDAGFMPRERIAHGDFAWPDLREAFFDGFHRSIAAFAAAGNNLIIEHIFDTPGWLEQLAQHLRGCDVFFVGIHCSLPELRRRELARGDRREGEAEADCHSVHQGMRYDYEMSSEGDWGANADQLLAAWRSRAVGQSVFDDLAGGRSLV